MNGTEVLCYTRRPESEEVYAAKLAYSMHLALRNADGTYEILNHNSGVLFAEATQDADSGLLTAKSLKNPYLFAMKDGYGVVAIRTEAYGEPDESSRGKILLFTTEDLLQYRELPLLELPEDESVLRVAAGYDPVDDKYEVRWCNASYCCYKVVVDSLTDIHCDTARIQIEDVPAHTIACDIPGCEPCNILTVPDAVGKRLRNKLKTPVNDGVEVPNRITASCREDVEKVMAKSYYSDGSTVMKRVDWNLDRVDFATPGEITVRGKIHQEHFPFPISINRADPCIGQWNGKYYFIATNDADWNHTLYIREADSIPELQYAQEHLILDCETYPHIKGLLWAPEFHVIDGKMYIFHAATTGEFVHEQSHVMMLKEGGDPKRKEDWTEPRRVVRKDGSELCTNGITLDMTVWEDNGNHYAAWSQRQFEPIDLGAWLYIAKIDPREPWRLVSDPVVLSMPTYGWANNHTFVDEGPYALITEKKIFLTFSSALVDSTYVVGLLSADHNTDLTDPKNWVKKNYPILTSRSMPGEYGTGHNAYVQDEDGLIYNTYHARPGINAPRSSGIRRVHFDAEGEPVLDMTEDLDLNERLANVTMKVVIKPKGENAE